MILIILFSCKPTYPEFTNDMVWIEDGGEGYFIDKYEYPNVEGEKPTAGMNLDMAKENCQQQGKRLCTSFEWRRACMGKEPLRFGYGENYSPTKCYTNTQLSSGHNSIKEVLRSLEVSGQKDGCKSADGVFDMVGNLEEWVLDDFNGRDGSLEGGAWYTFKEYADCTGRYSRQPDFRLTTDRVTDSAGARCCYRESQLLQTDITRDAFFQSTDQPSPEYQTEDEIEIESGVWMDRYEYPNISGHLPLTGINWTEANQRCEDGGKRLCTAKEWEFACTNNNQSQFPYGDKYSRGHCSDSLQKAQESGKAQLCKNELGVFDLTGGVWEWIADGQRSPELSENRIEQRKELRGGSWYTDSYKAQCRPLSGYPLAAADAYFPDVGFRCCRGEKTSQTPQQNKIETDFMCPEGMSLIYLQTKAPSSFCIDKFEFPNRSNQSPKVNVSLSQAKEFCAAAQKTLCTKDMWIEACEGPSSRRWSYGSEYVPDRCNHNAPDGEGAPHIVGSSPDCKTPEGVYDMTGNVWELTQTGSVYGGSWNFSAGMGQCRAKASPEKGYSDREIGFRCCIGDLGL